MRKKKYFTVKAFCLKCACVAQFVEEHEREEIFFKDRKTFIM